jgi:Centromere protein H (CENP-H)
VSGLRARDTYAMVAAAAMGAVEEGRGRRAEGERRARERMSENEGIAEQMVGMAEELRGEEEGLDRVGTEMRERIEEEEKAVRKAKSEWRVMKGLVSGIVVGSGVDWAADPRLVEIVAEDDQLEH